MLTWNRFPFVRFAIAGIIGILAFERFQELYDITSELVAISSVGLVLCWTLIILFKINWVRNFAGIFGLTLIATLFGLQLHNQQELSISNHWRHFDDITAFEGNVIAEPLEKTSTMRYTIKVNSVYTADSAQAATGKLHLYIKRESSFGLFDKSNNTLNYGDQIRVFARPSAIPPPTNPEEFNYAAYVAREQIHGQSFTTHDRVEVIGNDPRNPILAFSFGLRHSLQEKITRYISNKEAQSIALALLIGVKDFLSDDIKTAYASAGAMHVLAVSGLHVGILYMVLLVVLKPLTKRKSGELLVALISVTIIWIYAMLTGLSPSVLRAAVMFSVVAMGNTFGRDKSIYNSIGIAAFILLLWNPNLLFSVGFQLSFLALTGIVYLQPRIYRWIYVSNPFLNKVWEISAVSIAAQVATLPLTVYYFNQFPTYFFISNLVVIPGATLIMFIGVGMLAVGSIWDFGGYFIGFFLDGLIQLMNYLVLAVEAIPGSLVTWLYLDSTQTWLLYGGLVLILMGFYHRFILYLSMAVLVISTAFGISYVRNWDQLHDEELVVYDLYTTTAVDWIKGDQATLFLGSEEEADFELLRFQIDPFRRANGLNSFTERIQEFDTLASFGDALKIQELAGHRVTILDGMLSGYTIKEPIETDILIINNHSVKSVDWMIKNFKFKHLLIGSQNSNYYSEDFKTKLFKEGISAHSLLIDGSWRMKITDSG